MERRLAAILIADVVGYGRLSQVDEEGTRARFQADLKKIFEPQIAAHRGRLVKTMGDGLLVEFASVVDAVRCAVEVQKAKAKQNAPLAERRLDFRIGVNLGDVIVEDGDIHGDGVNIADRLQGLADPGGIAISGTAYDQVKARLPVGYASLGEQAVKNIAEPVRVYRVSLDPAAAGTTVLAGRRGPPLARSVAIWALVLLALAAATGWWFWRPGDTPPVAAAADDRPSLVVLPFDNLSSDAEQGYLADGITEDLTTELARIPGLFVISRTAAFTYRDKEMQPAEIAAELGVRYLLEGSIRRVGDEMRINAQLIDAKDAGHMWAERFDGAWAEVFELQDKVLAEVTDALEVRLVSGPAQAGSAGGTAVPAAYEAYLKGLENLRRETPADLARAAAFYGEAVELDPAFGRAWADLALVYWISWDVAEREAALGMARTAMLPKVYASLEEAKKHPSASYYRTLATVLTQQRDLEAAVSAAESAVALDPSDPYGYEALSLALTYSGRPAEAERNLALMARVDPSITDWRRYLAAIAQFGQDRFEEAARGLEAIDAGSNDYWSWLASRYFLASAYSHLDRLEDATATARTLEAEIDRRGETSSSILLAQSYFPLKQTADRKRFFEGLRKAGMPDLPFGFTSRIGDQLDGEEARALLFGHEIEGQTGAGATYGRITALDGATQVKLGTGPWSSSVTSIVEGDAVCAWDKAFGGSCGVILRNPEGSFENRNEYVFVRAYDYREFSVVK